MLAKDIAKHSDRDDDLGNAGSRQWTRSGQAVRDHHVGLAIATAVHGRFPVIAAAALPLFRS
ncbi:MAG: hypothetical protein MUC36_03640 [Planctomycetes bacterium]|nr:hypothetical protein [Planctomycetota bacterium]